MKTTNNCDLELQFIIVFLNSTHGRQGYEIPAIQIKYLPTSPPKSREKNTLNDEKNQKSYIFTIYEPTPFDPS